MRPVRLLFFSLSLLLAACSRNDETPAAERPAQTPRLGDVALDQPLRLVGTEPFWAVEITSSALIYSGVDQPERRAPNPGPAVNGSLASWTTAFEDGGEVTVTLSATECSDGMSDRIYPLTARVEADGRTLLGCAASSAAVANAPETGRVS